MGAAVNITLAQKSTSYKTSRQIPVSIAEMSPSLRPGVPLIKATTWALI